MLEEQLKKLRTTTEAEEWSTSQKHTLEIQGLEFFFFHHLSSGSTLCLSSSVFFFHSSFSLATSALREELTNQKEIEKHHIQQQVTFLHSRLLQTERALELARASGSQAQSIQLEQDQTLRYVMEWRRFE